MRMVRGFYNEQNNTMNVIHYDTNHIISIDCGKWEQVFGPLPREDRCTGYRGSGRVCEDDAKRGDAGMAGCVE